MSVVDLATLRPRPSAEPEPDPDPVAVLVEARAKAARIVDHARSEAEQLVTQTRAQAVAAATSEADLTRRQLLLDAQEEAAAARAGLDAELDVRRAEHEQNVERHRADLAAELEAKAARARAAAQRLIDDAKAQAKQDAAELHAAIQRDTAKDRTDAAKALAAAKLQQAEATRAGEQAGTARDAAQQLLARARAQHERRTRWATRRRRFGAMIWGFAPWVSLAAAVGLAASGEYRLAVLVGISAHFAPLLPVAIDVYAVTAFRTGRDVKPALLLMFLANIAYHLSIPTTGSTWLVIAVVAAFVTIVWRVHALLGNHDEEPDADAMPAPDAGPERPVYVADVRTQPARTESAAPGRNTVRTQSTAAGRNPGRNPARTKSVPPGRNPGSVPARTEPGRSGRPVVPSTAAELAAVRTLPVEADGYVNVNRVRTALGVRTDRAARILADAGLLRPSDADKHLAPSTA